MSKTCSLSSRATQFSERFLFQKKASLENCLGENLKIAIFLVLCWDIDIPESLKLQGFLVSMSLIAGLSCTQGVLRSPSFLIFSSFSLFFIYIFRTYLFYDKCLFTFHLKARNSIRF